MNKENAARRALAAAEESLQRRRTSYEAELARSQTLSNDVAHLRTMLQEEQEKTRLLKNAVGERKR